MKKCNKYIFIVTEKCPFSLLFVLVEVQQYQSKGALHVSSLEFCLVFPVLLV